MDWIVEPSIPAFAALFPDSTGMLTLSKNRMAHLLTVWFFRFTQHRTIAEFQETAGILLPIGGLVKL
jgi:hypothetical protein